MKAGNWKGKIIIYMSSRIDFSKWISHAQRRIATRRTQHQWSTLKPGKHIHASEEKRKFCAVSNSNDSTLIQHHESATIYVGGLSLSLLQINAASTSQLPSGRVFELPRKSPRERVQEAKANQTHHFVVPVYRRCAYGIHINIAAPHAGNRRISETNT